MTDSMDMSEHPLPPARSGLFSLLHGYEMETPSAGEDVAMQDVTYLNEQLSMTKQELERSRNDCHRLNHAFTSMVDYFTKDGGADSSTAVSSLADHKTSKTAQPIIGFDDDNFEHHLRNRKASQHWDGSLLDSVCSDLVSISVSEPSDSWSSSATRCSSSTSSSPAHGFEVFPVVRQEAEPPQAHEFVQDAVTSLVASLESEIMELAITDDHDVKDREDGEIVEAATAAVELEAMPATFWKYYPDSPHPRNFLSLGISFNPEPQDIGTENTRKTVLLQNLPPGTSTARVLGNVRGGYVVACTVVPAARLQGYDAAYVQFKDAAAAAAYADFTRAHPPSIDGWPLVVSHMTSATYPLNPHVHDAVHRYGATRCLRIAGLSSAEQLHGVLLQHFRTPLVIEAVFDDPATAATHQKAIIARFAGVEIAGRAWWLLKYAPASPFTSSGNAMRIEYLPDPCNAPLSTLLFKIAKEGRGRNSRGDACGGGWDPAYDDEVLYLDY